mmetsp:Transcript_21932/g.37500  ORF Transcript_21932/g.37500 Transcript_21932/m.37500 type:complete len:203 (+) Transcript_21932:1531-2139(+)
MQTKASILVGVIPQISYVLQLVLRAENVIQHSTCVQTDQQARHEKHRASIVSRPVPILLLQTLVKGDGTLEVLFHTLSLRAARGKWAGRKRVCLAFYLVRILQAQQLIRAMFLLMSIVGETLAQLFCSEALLWGAGFCMPLPSLAPNEPVQRVQQGMLGSKLCRCATSTQELPGHAVGGRLTQMPLRPTLELKVRRCLLCFI